jgi:hypothetical protein
MSKKELGQFYSTESDYILNGLDCDGFNLNMLIEPFVGGGDILKWIITNTNIDVKDIDIFDIKPNKILKEINPDVDLEAIMMDTLTNPPDFNNKYIITNPPYLAKNKNKNKNNKKIFDTYKNCSDLFRVHIHQIIEGNCAGGIQIIPLNFFSSIKKEDIALRNRFLSKYKIIRLNIFEEPVFKDTNYTVCSFKFIRNGTEMTSQNIYTYFFPSNIMKTCVLSKENNWLFGGEIYNIKINKKLKLDRLTLNKKVDEYTITSIKLICLDSGSEKGKIRAEFNTEPFYGKQTDRVFATIIIKGEVKLTDDKQTAIINDFNKYLNEMRAKYNSLFLTNYRESKNGNGRKRISFTLCYKLLNHFIQKHS